MQPAHASAALGHDHGMSTPAHAPSSQLADPDRRLTELEIKAAYTEDLLDQLNAVVVRQQQEIDALKRLVQALQQQQPPAEPPPFRSLRDELPPHY